MSLWANIYEFHCTYIDKFHVKIFLHENEMNEWIWYSISVDHEIMGLQILYEIKISHICIRKQSNFPWWEWNYGSTILHETKISHKRTQSGTDKGLNAEATLGVVFSFLKCLHCIKWCIAHSCFLPDEERGRFSFENARASCRPPLSLSLSTYIHTHTHT